MGIQSLRNSLKGLIGFLEQSDRIVNLILSRPDVQQFIIKMNTDDQLFKDGINNLGVTLESIGGSYTSFTISEKTRKGQPTDRITLKDTGDFYSSFRIELGSDFFEITANTIKDGTDLRSRWGDEILGLTDENLQRLIDKLRNEIEIVVRKEIQKRFAA